jgi:hypothetical protein
LKLFASLPYNLLTYFSYKKTERNNTELTSSLNLTNACFPETSGSSKIRLLGGTLPMVSPIREVSEVIDMRSPLEGPDVTSKDKVLISAQPNEQIRKNKRESKLI